MYTNKIRHIENRTVDKSKSRNVRWEKPKSRKAREPNSSVFVFVPKALDGKPRLTLKGQELFV